MKKYISRSWVLTMGLMVLASQIPSGCDSGTGDNSELDNFFVNHPYVSDPRTGIRSTVTLSPAAVTVNTIGGKAVFSLVGGNEPISWNVSNAGVGSLVASGGSATYTAIVVGDNSIIAYDRDGNAAIAHISGSLSQPSIAADSSLLSTNGVMTVLRVSGGTAPYSWSVTDNSRGAIQGPTTGLSVIYQRSLPGDNAVTVVDGVGSRASKVISQP